MSSNLSTLIALYAMSAGNTKPWGTRGPKAKPSKTPKEKCRRVCCVMCKNTFKVRGRTARCRYPDHQSGTPAR